jgi:hypothetical protein
VPRLPDLWDLRAVRGAMALRWAARGREVGTGDEDGGVEEGGC